MKNFAVETAQQAGEILKKYYHQELEINTKSSDIDLVTQADIESEKFIISAIHKQFPGHAILAEETGQSGKSEYLWIVDPLDGTTNFAHKHPMFAVTISLVRHEEVMLGVTYDPLRDELFVAEKGKGATLNGQPISVSQIKEIHKALVATGFPYKRHIEPPPNIPELTRVMPNVQGIRRGGSAALDVAYVACGRLDGYWESSLHLWDWIGGVLMVKEAGGIVTQMDGITWSMKSTTLVVGNPFIQPTLLKMVQ